MDILGYVIVKTVMGYDLRTSVEAENFVYRCSSIEGIFGYLAMNGYPRPPYTIPLVIES